MNVSPEKLGIEGEQDVDIINLKCDPELIQLLINDKSFFPAYHMNKNNLISILINKNISGKDHFRLKKVIPKNGCFQSFHTARKTLKRYEAILWIKKRI